MRGKVRYDMAWIIRLGPARIGEAWSGKARNMKGDNT